MKIKRDSRGDLNQALQMECIEHWTRMLDLSIEDIRDDIEAPTPANCAFCREYFAKECVGCPIRSATGEKFCRGTPYNTAQQRYTRIADDYTNCLVDFKDAVKEEIDFLTQLKIGIANG